MVSVVVLDGHAEDVVMDAPLSAPHCCAGHLFVVVLFAVTFASETVAPFARDPELHVGHAICCVGSGQYWPAGHWVGAVEPEGQYCAGALQAGAAVHVVA